MNPTPNTPVQVIPFVAATAEDAVAQIRARLGPDAVVVNVRQLPADGLTKLWKAPRIEVLAYKPEPPEASSQQPAAPDPLAELKQELQTLRQEMGDRREKTEDRSRKSEFGSQNSDSCLLTPDFSQWRAGTVLETSGLLPVHAQRVLEQLQARHGERPPGSLAEELVLTRTALAGLWPQLPESSRNEAGLHVLIGPPGAGKTTCLCKWLAQARLVQGRSARVWRLDGATANTAEALSVYCEILGAPAERLWDPAQAPADAELNFIDLPGVDWRNPTAVRDLKQMLEALSSKLLAVSSSPTAQSPQPTAHSHHPVRIHLVLNAAYEVPLLVAQARAYAALPIEDLILTHLDEEARWGKIWNVVLGTNYPVRFLSAAQNVPGEFFPATAERILARQFAP